MSQLITHFLKNAGQMVRLASLGIVCLSLIVWRALYREKWHSLPRSLNTQERTGLLTIVSPCQWFEPLNQTNAESCAVAYRKSQNRVSTYLIMKPRTNTHKGVWVQSATVLLVLLSILSFGCINCVPRETIIAPEVAEFRLDFIRSPFSAVGIPIITRKDSLDSFSHFAIDTGSEAITISEAFATRMGFSTKCTVPYTIVGAANERHRSKRVVRIEELKFENPGSQESVAFRQFDALVAETPLFDLGVEGILGAPLLAQCTFTIDFATDVLKVERNLIDRDSSYTAPIRVTNGGLIYVAIEVSGETRWALLDTGSSGFLSVPEGRWADLKLKNSIFEGHTEGFSFGGASHSKLSQLDGCIVFAGQTIQNPFVTSNPGKYFGIGSGLLKGYALSIDQRSRLVRLVSSVRKAQSRPAN